MAPLSYFAPDESHAETRASEHHSRGLGELLRSARARRGLALQQLSHETKIPRRYLEALEQDRLEALPSGLYRRAHVRAYAQAVQLDPALALAQLERDMKASGSIEVVPEPRRGEAAVALTRTGVLIRIGLQTAAHAERLLRKQALYVKTQASYFISWAQQQMAQPPRSEVAKALKELPKKARPYRSLLMTRRLSRWKRSRHQAG